MRVPPSPPIPPSPPLPYAAASSVAGGAAGGAPGGGRGLGGGGGGLERGAGCRRWGAGGRAVRGCSGAADLLHSSLLQDGVPKPRCSPCGGTGWWWGHTHTTGGGHFSLHRCHQYPVLGESGEISGVGVMVRCGARLRVGVV